MRLLLGLILLAVSANAQWTKYDVKSPASFRGLSVVNEKVVWASGTSGTVIRTVDGGKTWEVHTVPGGEKLDFRDIEAFDEDEAYILSIGNGGDSQILHTTDGGNIWELQFQNKDPKAFFDAIACWDRRNCIAMSDPVDGKFVLISTNDNGFRWRHLDTSQMPRAKDGEAAFAASGTCLITQGRNNVFLVTGGSDARVFKSTDRGKTWNAYKTPIVRGTAGSGIFGIAMHDAMNGVIVGGNYEKPTDGKKTFAVTRDGGRTWRKGTDLFGFRSAIAYLSPRMMIAVGSSGANYTATSGKYWQMFDPGEYNAIDVAHYGKHSAIVWVVGAKGIVRSLDLYDVRRNEWGDL